MPALDLAGDYGADVRPARVGSGRKAWAKDPSGASATDGTRLDATFVNDLVGMIRAAATAYSVAQTPGDDDLLADILAAAIGTRAPLASPALTGTPTAPTATTGTSTTQIATTAFVQATVAALIAAAPGALDTLDELAAALGDDANFAATMTTALAGKQPLHANLTGLAALADPNADRILFWDDSAGAFAHLTLGTNLSITGTTLDAAGGSFTGGLLTSALGIIAGAAATPGLYFDGDTNTGLWSPGADIIGFATAGVARARFNASGHLTFDTDNSYDIGASGANRPRTIYAAGSIYSGNHLNLPGALLWNNGSNIQSPSSGVMTLYNNGNTSFGRLQLGGTGSGSPSIKVSGTAIHLRLADDSAFTEFKASILECGTSIKFPDATTQTTAANPKVDLIGSWAYSTDVAQVEITWTAGTYAKVWIETDNLSGTANAALVATLRNASTAIVTLTSNDTTTAASALSVDSQFTIGLAGATKYCSGVMVDSVAAVYAGGSNGTAPDRVRLAWAAGNIDGGSIRVYGLKAS